MCMSRSSRQPCTRPGVTSMMPIRASTSAVSGPRWSSARHTARTTCWPIQKPEPSSPINHPRPSDMAANSPSLMRAPVAPVPTISTAPSASAVAEKYAPSTSPLKAVRPPSPAAARATSISGTRPPAASTPAMHSASTLGGSTGSGAPSSAWTQADTLLATASSRPAEVGLPGPAFASESTRPVSSSSTARVPVPPASTPMTVRPWCRVGVRSSPVRASGIVIAPPSLVTAVVMPTRVWRVNPKGTKTCPPPLISSSNRSPSACHS
ncbi:Uncharacterised protein [Mycobacteroides abscessus subsp. abscessus]|nr:Uncharacterised protein [Mycobacteroides abscessus subsp. abscessus]